MPVQWEITSIHTEVFSVNLLFGKKVNNAIQDTFGNCKLRAMQTSQTLNNIEMHNASSKKLKYVPLEKCKFKTKCTVQRRY